MKDMTELKNEVARTMSRLVRRGLTTTTGGNVSARSATGEVCITPSQVDKEFITADQIGMISSKGVFLAMRYPPGSSRESSMPIRHGRHPLRPPKRNFCVQI